MREILGKIAENLPLCREEIISLLSIKVMSEDYFNLLALSNAYAKSVFTKGYVFVQIGIDSAPCSGGCKFCSLAKGNFVGEKSELSTEQILDKLKTLDIDKIDALFLMTTADFDRAKYLDILRAVRAKLPQKIDVVANTGDCTLQDALLLKEAGTTAVYHIVRLREGIDTCISQTARENTIQNVISAGLKLYYCVEPIGSEHTAEELADEMIRARSLGVDVMAVMKRVNTPNSKLKFGEISALELSKICAVAMLVVRPKTSMNAHECNTECMFAGVNQLYAEMGANPRDTERSTENSRGYSVKWCRQTLAEFGYKLS